MSERRSNDQRADVYNPTSSDFIAANNNRANQINPNNSAYHRSRGK